MSKTDTPEEIKHRLELFEEHDARRKAIIVEIDNAELRYEAAKKETKSLKDDLENWHQALIAHDRTEPGQSSLFGPAGKDAEENTPENQRAYHEGIAAHREGLQLTACPYSQDAQAECWRRGYEWESARHASKVETRTIDLPEGLTAYDLKARFHDSQKWDWSLGPVKVPSKAALEVEGGQYVVVDEIGVDDPMDERDGEITGYWLCPCWTTDHWEQFYADSIGPSIPKTEENLSPYEADGHGDLCGLQIKLGKKTMVLGSAKEYVRVVI